jgi:NAD(P)-dependent dehydrogenase (short-subunit alcohol dehydrogenase family)
MNALGTLAMPQDIAPLYVFLASEAARHITGAAYTHDSGFNLRF